MGRLADRPAFVAAALVGLCGAYCAREAPAQAPAQTRELRLKEIAAKSESERARLEKNFKAFRQLTAAEQDKLRRLDRELKDDARTGQGQLQKEMDQYYTWLLTLTPGEAYDLRTESDPNKREKKVRELIKQQQDHAAATGSPPGGFFAGGLSDEDFAAVLQVMEDAMRAKTLSHEEIKQLDRKKGLARQAYLMELAYPPRQRMQWQAPAWYTEPVFEQMLERISNEKQAHFVRSGPPKQHMFRLTGLVWRTLWGKFEKLKPDSAELDRFFADLSAAEKDEIMRLNYDQQPRQLTYMYLEKKSKDDPENYPPPPPWLRPGRAGGMRPGAFPGRGMSDQPREGNPRGGKKAGKRARDENE